MNCKLIWATPNIDEVIGYIARVSNPANQDNPDVAKLFDYMERNGHVSPFEMANVCVEINTTRDIGRQILRHRSFSFQEFSQRYADANLLGDMVASECRLQDTKNRQNSITISDDESEQAHALRAEWRNVQKYIFCETAEFYHWALAQGIAKEVARKLLPEGLTPTRMYMNGTMRSWIHYLRSRLDPTTQKEHRLVAAEVLTILRNAAPQTIGAFFKETT